ncbi:F-box/WD repeat-containing protein 2-like [Sapajus apella]|uniref:F-box/WD repeat-containing protein 2-like n=1 Tax=Sapajus apella TaxID=9515 RepID=A0A6J3H742_SAPAP|nr:F-box/WD repeat-containing protein 2-like [Sapajus apella]
MEGSACSQDFIWMANTLSTAQHAVSTSNFASSYAILRVIKTPEIANLAFLGFGNAFALLFDSHHLYITDLQTQSLISRWPLPEYRKSKRGSSFLPSEASWLNGPDGHNDTGLVFASSMPDHSIHLVWKEHG